LKHLQQRLPSLMMKPSKRNDWDDTEADKRDKSDDLALRRFKIAPGVTLNLSKRGASVSLGEKVLWLIVFSVGLFVLLALMAG
jgi:hypothetical protein